jgi:hypothetical protein
MTQENMRWRNFFLTKNQDDGISKASRILYCTYDVHYIFSHYIILMCNICNFLVYSIYFYLFFLFFSSNLTFLFKIFATHTSIKPGYTSDWPKYPKNKLNFQSFKNLAHFYFHLSPPLPYPPLKRHSSPPLKRRSSRPLKFTCVHLHLHFWNSIWKIGFSITCSWFCNFPMKLCWFWVSSLSFELCFDFLGLKWLTWIYFTYRR